MVRYLLIGLMMLVVSIPLWSQKQASIWYFGQHAGLDFRSGKAVALTDGALDTFEGSASICDEAGNLLFYTDGVTVWDRLHQAMPNGRNLWGSYTTTQTLIVPKPGVDPLYYIFTASPNYDYVFGFGTDSVGFHYSVVDMRNHGGLGDVTDKNILLFRNTTEKVTAVHHANGNDIWVVAHEWGNNVFRSYLVTENGISPEPVLSAIGEIHIGGGEPQVNNSNSIGQMKLSPDGSKIAVAIYRQSIIEIFSFNKATGRLEAILNRIHLPHGDGSAGYFYGLEFSPGSKSLFYTKSELVCGNNEHLAAIFQYVFSGSKTLKVGTFLGSMNAMQLALDGRIYIAVCNDLANQSGYAGVINYPWFQGEQCDLKPLGIGLLTGKNYLGLPGFIQSYFNLPDAVLEMPNVFTPNGDRYNPSFKPIRFEHVLTAHLQIFNRWGKKVFSTDNVETGWDGNGSSPGVYYWVLTYESLNGKTGTLKGWVMLIGNKFLR